MLRTQNEETGCAYLLRLRSMMSPDGACKSFDASGNGYARAEGVAVVVLRRAGVIGTPFTAPRKPYAQILGIGTNSDGFKDNGITFPSDTAQSALSTKVGSCSHIIVRQLTRFGPKYHARRLLIHCNGASR